MGIKNVRATSFVSFLLIYALTFGASPVVRGASLPQQRQRERRVNAPSTAPATQPTPAPQTTPASRTTPASQPTAPRTQATPTPTPSATPTRRNAPAPTPSPLTRPTPSSPTRAAPTPTPAAALPTPTPVETPSQRLIRQPAPRTLEDLRARIGEIIAQPELASSHISVKIVSLETGRTLFEQDAGKWMQPASNLKLYTWAAALDRLSPDYHFVTSVYAAQRPDAAGTLRGDLTIYGRGDPTFATRFNGGDYFKAIDELAARVVAAGVRRVEGDIVGDESYFTGLPISPGWEWDDLQWYYGAEVSALSVNDNAIDLFVRPGLREGASGIVTTGPALPQDVLLLTVAPDADAPAGLSADPHQIKIINRTTTSPRGTKRELTVFRSVGENMIEVTGSLPVDDAGFNAAVAVVRPALLFTSMLRASLERQGVRVMGRTRTVDARTRAASPLQVSSLTEIASRQSPPLSLIAAQTLKPSQNLYSELALRALGKTTATDTRQASDEAGIAAVKSFLRTAGIDAERVVMLDGSGLSRSNLVTAETTLQLLTYMSRHRYAAAYFDAQPIAGVDGTLRTRMRATPAAGNVRAKTGTLSTATSLSGYVTSAAGERLVFSIMINNPPQTTNPRASFTDAIAILLASFEGRS